MKFLLKRRAQKREERTHAPTDAPGSFEKSRRPPPLPQEPDSTPVPFEDSALSESGLGKSILPRSSRSTSLPSSTSYTFGTRLRAGEPPPPIVPEEELSESGPVKKTGFSELSTPSTGDVESAPSGRFRVAWRLQSASATLRSGTGILRQEDKTATVAGVLLNPGLKRVVASTDGDSIVQSELSETKEDRSLASPSAAPSFSSVCSSAPRSNGTFKLNVPASSSLFRIKKLVDAPGSGGVLGSLNRQRPVSFLAASKQYSNAELVSSHAPSLVRPSLAGLSQKKTATRGDGLKEEKHNGAGAATPAAAAEDSGRGNGVVDNTEAAFGRAASIPPLQSELPHTVNAVHAAGEETLSDRREKKSSEETFARVAYRSATRPAYKPRITTRGVPNTLASSCKPPVTTQQGSTFSAASLPLLPSIPQEEKRKGAGRQEAPGAAPSVPKLVLAGANKLPDRTPSSSSNSALREFQLHSSESPPKSPPTPTYTSSSALRLALVDISHDVRTSRSPIFGMAPPQLQHQSAHSSHAEHATTGSTKVLPKEQATVPFPSSVVPKTVPSDSKLGTPSQPVEIPGSDDRSRWPTTDAHAAMAPAPASATVSPEPSSRSGVEGGRRHRRGDAADTVSQADVKGGGPNPTDDANRKDARSVPSQTPNSTGYSLSHWAKMPQSDENAEAARFTDLPVIADVAESERLDVFLQKLAACSVVYDFTKPQLHLAAKEAKRETLLELVEYISNTRNCFTDPVIRAIIQMVSANVFRSLPPSNTNAVNALGLSSGSAVGAPSVALFDADDEEHTPESAWPHLQIVYEVFLRFIVSNEVDPKAAKRYIDQRFVLKLLDLFASEDPRERDYLKTILHRIYGKIMTMRSFIRKAIQHTFLCFIYEQETHQGVAELLEILGSIINGFAVPLKPEHKFFLENALIPLHKTRTLSTFSEQLTFCMSQYLEKDATLVEPVILGLLKYWPVTNTNKEVVFLNEIEELLEFAQQEEFEKIMCPLFQRIAACIQSPHFQVAERVLFMWNNDYLLALINHNRDKLYPILVSALYRNSKDHWNSTVHGLTYNVSKLLAEVDPKLFDECSNQNLAREEKSRAEAEARQAQWAALEMRFQNEPQKTMQPDE